MLNRSLLLAVAPYFLVSAAFSQPPPGKLLGVVRGVRSEKLSEISVQLSREDFPALAFKTQTNSSGEFSFVGLPSGFYTLELVSRQTNPYKREHLEIVSATTLELSVNLLPAGAQPGRSGPTLHLLDAGVSWGTEFSGFARNQLPHARNIGSILESQEPSTVTNRLDVGGLEIGVPALFGALGASWTENQYDLNGFDVTDPYIPGRPLLDPDWDALAEFQVVDGAKQAGFAGSGVTLMLGTPRASKSFHGATRFFYAGHGTQSDNLDARLRRFQFPGPERLKNLADANVQLGGKLPLASAPWPAFVSLGTQQLSKHLGGFAAPIDVHVYRALAEFTPFLRDAQRLDVLYAGQHIFNSRQGADPRIEPSATTRGNDNFHHFQARWSRTLSSSALLTLGFGVVHTVLSSGLQSGLQGASTLELPLLTRKGPAPLSTAGLDSRYEVNGTFGTLRKTAVGTHSLDLGVDWERSYVASRWDALGGMEQVLVEGLGAEVIRWNTPTQARQHTQNFALFAQDSWRPATWLRVPLGVRVETSSGRAAAADNGIRWTTIEPRAGLVVPITRHGLVLRASWSRYAHLLQVRYLDFGNPRALGEQMFLWQDLNGDGRAQPQEIAQELQVAGGPYSEVDRHLARPFTDEISAGMDQDLGQHLRASVRFFRRDDHRLVGLLNLGVPPASYTPVNVLDPGNDGISGTADDQALTLFNRNVSALGRDFFLLSNPPGDRSSYKGFEIRLVKPLRHLWEFSSSFTAMQTLAPTNPGNSVFQNDTGFVGSLYTDPNTLLFDSSRTYFDRAFIGKATGYYQAPRGFQLAAVVKYYDGLPFGRLLFINGFNQGPFFVRATPRGHPGGFQTQFNFTLDVRLARQFAIRRGTLSGYLDFFNVLNMNRNTLEADLTGPEFQSRVPLAVESPRVGRLGIEWRF